MNLGKSLRDEGTEAALANAGVTWHDRAVLFSLDYFLRAGPLGALFEDVREHATAQGLNAPPSSNAWGAVCLAMSRRNQIVKTGEYRSSRAVRSHARSQPVWRHAMYEGADPLNRMSHNNKRPLPDYWPQSNEPKE